MFPIIFSIGPITIYSFGFLLAIGLLVYIFSGWRRLRELGLVEEKVVDFLLLSILLMFVAGRLSYGLVNLSEFGPEVPRWLLIGRWPGLALNGLLLGMVLALCWYAKKRAWSFWRVADQLVFVFLPLVTLFFLGSFFAGSFLGSQTSLFWGIFSPGDLVRRHPAALYGAVYFFLVWLGLTRVERQWRTWSVIGDNRDGFISLLFAGLFCFGRFWLAFWEASSLYWSTAKLVIYFFSFAAVGWWLWQRHKIASSQGKPFGRQKK